MNNKSLAKSITTIISIILFALCMVLVYKSIKAHRENKLMYIFNHSYSVVPTPSMEPVIMTNDIIIVKDVSFSEIKVDDIIVYFSETEGLFIVHRVIGIYPDGSLHTKGDNNLADDKDPSPTDSYTGVSEDLYLGKVVKITHFLGLGYLLVNIRSLLLVIVVIIFVVFLVLEILKVVKTVKNKNEETPQENKSEDIEAMREKLRQEVLKELEKEKDEKK